MIIHDVCLYVSMYQDPKESFVICPDIQVLFVICHDCAVFKSLRDHKRLMIFNDFP